jgi:hypothetical protein
MERQVGDEMRMVSSTAKKFRLGLGNPVVLLQVVPGTEQLNVLGNQRRTAKRKRDDVVEMNVIPTATLDASPTVSFPNRELHVGWYETILWKVTDHAGDFSGRFSCDRQFELEDASATTRLCPAINQ